MRINTLSITGFGPYRTTQTVNFDAYTDDGLFLISGKTGAGKSSILDAIAFALYDSVPRFDGTKARLRSDHCAPSDETRVELEFTIGDTRYRVTRSPEYERRKKSGAGTTMQKSTAQLEVLTGDQWQGIASRPVDVGHELAEIVGMKKEQFLQVILLAQNRFQQFLLAGSRDREAVLRSLFGTKRFADYEGIVDERRRELEATVAATRAQTDQLISDAARLAEAEPPEEGVVDWLEHRVIELGTRVATAVSDAAAADTVRDDAEAKHTEATERQRRQKRLSDARARAAELNEAESEIAQVQSEQAAAERAEQVWPYVTAQRSAQDAADIARTRVATAGNAHAAAGGDATLTAEQLDAVAEKHSGRLALLEDVRVQESRLEALAAAEAEAIQRKSTAESALADLELRLAELPRALTAANDELTAARVEASRSDAATADVDRLVSARAAALFATEVERQRDVARQVEAECVRENTEASSALQSLLDARLAGHAAELAAELRVGEPCAVCGSTEHPSPATHAGTPVTEADVDAAREVLAAREKAKADAARAASALDEKLAEQRAVSGGRTLEQFDAELELARQRVSAAADAAATVTELEKKHASLIEERDAGDGRREQLRAKRDAQAATESEARTEIARITMSVDAQRGDAASIAEVVSIVTVLRDSAAMLASALRTRDDRDVAAAEASEKLAQSMSEREFADAAAVENARRSGVDLERLRERIRTHDDARATVRSILAEPELADLPTEVPDIDATQTAVAKARAARDEALRIREALNERLTSLVRTVATVKERLAESATAAAEFERVRNLARTLAGDGPNTRKMRLEGFVLAAELERIVEAANARLRTMTGGRYVLEHDDSVQYRNVKSGLGLAIFDQHTGVARATHSLSGGETFLASLALALGLAEAVTARAGGITLDTLFIDEGFGSLDADTLEVAMSTLDSLRAGGRTVGLISHVEGMKEQIPAKLRITVADGGWSEIHQEM
ncbi:AAA family ATPase [Paramicrobacterium chengjingii]|uniref:Nuclease SbcCD subunit C n=1 Tax=Paramicrobacterium chengjingii TaxID=2769067 RepID=A0ABX6YGP4_9MICO|nr:SMC family ATPase [Microbacterium chengjingii]QPZ37938.1 SMC family ATPase [Microbacterium chengjingii]